MPESSSSSSKTCVIVAAVLAGSAFLFLVCGGILAGLSIPALQAAREAARRMQCSNNLKQLALALHNYESVYRSLPPAFTVDSEGNRLHSWRTLILPYLEQSRIYDQIDLSKPWNHPDNAVAFGTDIPMFRCPSSSVSPGNTTYVAVVDPRGIFSGQTPTKFGEIADGTSNTILVVEVRSNQSVHWMEPSDIDLKGFIDAITGPTRPGDSTPHTAGANVAFGDGSVQFLSSNTNAQTLNNVVTKDAGD